MTHTCHNRYCNMNASTGDEATAWERFRQMADIEPDVPGCFSCQRHGNICTCGWANSVKAAEMERHRKSHELAFKEARPALQQFIATGEWRPYDIPNLAARSEAIFYITETVESRLRKKEAELVVKGGPLGWTSVPEGETQQVKIQAKAEYEREKLEMMQNNKQLAEFKIGARIDKLRPRAALQLDPRGIPKLHAKMRELDREERDAVQRAAVESAAAEANTFAARVEREARRRVMVAAEESARAAAAERERLEAEQFEEAVRRSMASM